MPTDTKVETPEELPVCARLYYSGMGARRYKRASTRPGPGEPLTFTSVAQDRINRLQIQLTALTAELEEVRKQLAAANAKVLELAQQLHREQVRASRANPFVDRD